MFVFVLTFKTIYVCSELVLFMYGTCNRVYSCKPMNNLLSYCGLVDARVRASNKDLPVMHIRHQKIAFMLGWFQFGWSAQGSAVKIFQSLTKTNNMIYQSPSFQTWSASQVASFLWYFSSKYVCKVAFLRGLIS